MSQFIGGFPLHSMPLRRTISPVPLCTRARPVWRTATHAWGTMPYTLREAARAVGVDRTTLLRAVRAGRVSATRGEPTGAWLIEPAELHRVYPPIERTGAGEPDAEARIPNSRDAEIRELRVRLDAAESIGRVREDVITELRRRLDDSEQERRQTAERLHALLTDQRAQVRRTWWPWQR